jgi:glutamate:Na+ symporter, ESS family
VTSLLSDAGSLTVPDFLALTLGMVAFFLGVFATRKIAFLRTYNIPEPVTGGFIAALAFWAMYAVFDIEISFDMPSRDRLLVIFFATVGINARLADLLSGGRVLAVLCGLTAAYVFLQNLLGVGGAIVFDLPLAAGVMMGSAALVGGHGTTIAWAPSIAGEHGFPAAMETGIAVATLGLIAASLLGGLIAKYLIDKHGLAGEALAAGGPDAAPEADSAPIDKMGLMRALLAVNTAIVLGYLVHGPIVAAGIKLPLFVPCMIMSIVLSNTIPLIFPRLNWPARTPALRLVADYSLSVFLAMSLMSMQLWTLASVAGPLLIVVTAQVILAACFILFILFPLLGRDYQAAVLSSGYTGLTLGATPTAIANMTAVTKNYGPSPNVFVLLPLVSAFFVDLVNVVAIQFFLAR